MTSTDLPMCTGFSANRESLPDLQYSTNTPKVLLVCNDHDPETPYNWCQSLAATIPNSTIIYFTGAGHGIYLSNEPPGTCVKNDVNAYLLTGALPALGTICSDTHNPTTPSTS